MVSLTTHARRSKSLSASLRVLAKSFGKNHPSYATLRELIDLLELGQKDLAKALLELRRLQQEHFAQILGEALDLIEPDTLQRALERNLAKQVPDPHKVAHQMAKFKKNQWGARKKGD